MNLSGGVEQQDEHNANVLHAIFTYILLHELSHQLGAPDHYCYGDIEEDGTCSNAFQDCWNCDNNLDAQPTCLMNSEYLLDLEERLNNGTINTIYCSQCVSAIHSKGILTHLDDHHS